MRILLFAHLKEAAGCADMEVDWGELDANSLWEKLIEKHPGLARFRDTVRLARNSEYVGPDARFGPSDEVALIPPVSGG